MTHHYNCFLSIGVRTKLPVNIRYLALCARVMIERLVHWSSQRRDFLFHPHSIYFPSWFLKMRPAYSIEKLGYHHLLFCNSLGLPLGLSFLFHPTVRLFVISDSFVFFYRFMWSFGYHHLFYISIRPPLGFSPIPDSLSWANRESVWNLRRLREIATNGPHYSTQWKTWTDQHKTRTTHVHDFRCFNETSLRWRNSDQAPND